MRKTPETSSGPARLPRPWIACLLVTGMVLSLGLAPAGLVAGEKTLPADLALVPANEPIFYSIRLADLANSKVGKPLFLQLRKEVGIAITDLEKDLGVPLNEVERVTVLPMMTVFIVRTIKPYDRAKVLETLAPAGKEKKLQGQAVYVDETRGISVRLVDDHVFLKARNGNGLGIPDSPVAKERGPLSEALDLAAQNHHFVAGLNPMMVVSLRGGREPIRKTVPPYVQPELNPSDGASPPIPKPQEPPQPKEGPPPPKEIPPPPPGGGSREPGFQAGLQVVGEDPNTPPLSPSAPPSPQAKEITDRETQELISELPPEFLPYKPLLQARSVSLTIDLDEETRVEGRLTFPDPEVAKDGENALKTALYVAKEALPQAFKGLDEPVFAKLLIQPIQAGLKDASVQQAGNVVTASMRVKMDVTGFGAMVLQMRQKAERMQSANNLKQIVLAMHNFNDSMGYLPPQTIFSKDGKPLLSWRVAILPYIEQDNLYQQFRLDEPWDSPNNKKLLEKMPKTYAPVRDQSKEPYSTFYQVFVGPSTPFNQSPDGSAPFGAKGPRIPATFTDGTSNTFLVVEAGEAVPWTKPEDLHYNGKSPVDTKSPIPGLGGMFASGFNAAFADGSVRFIKKGIDDDTLRWLIMPNDGQVIDWDKVEGKNSSSEKTQPRGETPRQAEPPSPPAGDR